MLRCKNYRKDEHNRVGIGRFCNVKIELIIDLSKNLNDQKFKLICNHSNESYKFVKILLEIKDTINEWEECPTYCFNYSNNIKGEFEKNKAIDELKKIKRI